MHGRVPPARARSEDHEVGMGGKLVLQRHQVWRIVAAAAKRQGMYLASGATQRLPALEQTHARSKRVPRLDVDIENECAHGGLHEVGFHDMASAGSCGYELVCHQPLHRGAHDEFAHPQPFGERHAGGQELALRILATFDLFTKPLINLVRERVARKRVYVQASRVLALSVRIHLAVRFLLSRGIIANGTPNGERFYPSL